jgi:hypothetical protein
MRVIALIAVLLPCALHGADAVTLVRARQDEVLPAQFGSEASLVRLSDGAIITMRAGDMLDASPGAYRIGLTLLCIRADDSAAGWALGFYGLPVLPAIPKEHQQEWAETGSFDQFSFLVSSWRLADAYEWPWVDHGDFWGGLGGLCRRVNPDYSAYAYDAEKGAYVTAKGEPVVIAPSQPDVAKPKPNILALGDLVAVEGVVGLLIRDNGTLGALDPSDELVTAAVVEGQPQAVRTVAIGNLFLDAAVNCFARDRIAAQRLVRMRANGDDRNLGRLSGRSRYLLFLGMVLLVAVMLRHHRKKMRELKNR